jgi:hypothetical protein
MTVMFQMVVLICCLLVMELSIFNTIDIVHLRNFAYLCKYQINKIWK